MSAPWEESPNHWRCPAQGCGFGVFNVNAPAHPDDDYDDEDPVEEHLRNAHSDEDFDTPTSDAEEKPADLSAADLTPKHYCIDLDEVGAILLKRLCASLDIRDGKDDACQRGAGEATVRPADRVPDLEPGAGRYGMKHHPELGRFDVTFLGQAVGAFFYSNPLIPLIAVRALNEAWNLHDRSPGAKERP